MVILGLHFGHDSSISILRDGELLCCVELERPRRIKHSIGILYSDVMFILEHYNISIEEIDYCSVTSTQNVEYVFVEPKKLSFKIKQTPKTNTYCPNFDAKAVALLIEQEKTRGVLLKNIAQQTTHPYLKRLLPEFLNPDLLSVPPIETFTFSENWNSQVSIGELSNNVSIDCIESQPLVMHLPIEFRLGNHDIPGFLFSHHFAHAAASFFTSNMSEAAIFSHDGSLPNSGYLGGMLYYGIESKIYSLTPHYLSIGHLYERVAAFLGLGSEAGPGKMMGLAPYGQPVFYEDNFIQNFNINDAKLPDDNHIGFETWSDDDRHPLLNAWMAHIYKKTVELNYDMANIGNPDFILEPLSTDIAASTQKLLESIMLKTSHSLKAILTKLGIDTSNLCLSGGVALNCPANTLIAERSGFSDLFVPPSVHDGGLSIGACLATYHQLLNAPVSYNNNIKSSCFSYLGLEPKADQEYILDIIENTNRSLKVIKTDNIEKMAATFLSLNKYIALFEGRSEIGPRALGHRTILANPSQKQNWQCVNEIKYREQWRPFAPSVLEEHSAKWFTGAPTPSPFMLFTANAINNKLPAITHVDGTARIQTVDKGCGKLRKILENFYQITGVPVLMNTSFNGPGEPIVETPEDAIKFFANSQLDYLIIDNYLIEK